MMTRLEDFELNFDMSSLTLHIASFHPILECSVTSLYELSASVALASCTYLVFIVGFRIKGGPSAIGDHINQSGHAASFKDFSILD